MIKKHRLKLLTIELLLLFLVAIYEDNFNFNFKFFVATNIFTFLDNKFYFNNYEKENNYGHQLRVISGPWTCSSELPYHDPRAFSIFIGTK